MIKKIFVLGFLIINSIHTSRADEGMWLPMLVERLNYVDMQKMGCHLTPEEIFSLNKSSIKDAMVMLNDGRCSASIISPEGLLLTNHHCAFEAIQKQSSVENDLLKNGFWAMSRTEELRCEQFSASFLVRVENVTERVLKAVTTTMSETDRAAKVVEVSAQITSEATTGNFHKANVKSFFEGNEFYLFVYDVYKDVRLVGTPPEAIGKFGGETDNWTWPRQQGDFALLRVYMSAKNEPADYNKKNVPMKPKHFLPISIKGVEKEDFTMVMGYPGTSDRFKSSYGIYLATEQVNPAFVKIRDAKLKIIKEAMNGNDKIAIQYASKYAVSANYWKYFIGQTEILKKLKAFEKKKEIENKFDVWASADAVRKAKYGETFSSINKAYDIQKKYNLSKVYFKEGCDRGFELFNYAHTFEDLYDLMKAPTPDNEKIAQLLVSIKYEASKFYKNYNLDVDKKLFVAIIKMYYEDVPKDQHPLALTEAFKKYKGDWNAWANELYSKTIFASKDKLSEFLLNPTYKVVEKDLVYKAMQSFFQKNKEILKIYDESISLLTKGNRQFIEGLSEMDKSKIYYPNANSTMRLTYGKVTDYSLLNGKTFSYYSTLEDMIAKENANNPEFTIPTKLKDIYNKRDFGRYAKNGTLNVCFISNNDVIGGNSGASMLNGDGQLVGLVFDINWEATACMLAFEPELQRCINVDSRFILFIIDKYAGASHLIKEMTIIE